MVLLDASALLAVLNHEAGSDVVEDALPDAAILAVNLEEVVGILAMRGMPVEEVEMTLAPLALPTVSYTADMAWLSGRLRPRLAGGLGIADRACLSAAAVLGAGVVTADKAWPEAGRHFGVDVRLIRSLEGSGLGGA